MRVFYLSLCQINTSAFAVVAELEKGSIAAKMSTYYYLTITYRQNYTHSEKTEAELWPFNDTEQTRYQNFQVPVWGPIRSQHWHQVLPTKLWLSALWSLKHILCVLSVPVCSLERLFQMGCVRISSEVRWCSFTFPFSSSATELFVPLESLILLSWPWSRLDQLCYLACLFGLRCIPFWSPTLEPYT